MVRIALGIEYDGSAYSGWQQQAHARSVQAELQRALAGVATHEVTLTAAGRTDAGVHALMQVAHFDTSAVRPEHAWSLGATARVRRRRHGPLGARGAGALPRPPCRALPNLRLPDPEPADAAGARSIARVLGPPPARRERDARGRAVVARRARFHVLSRRRMPVGDPDAPAAVRDGRAGRRDRRDHRARQRVPAPHGAQHRGLADPGRCRRAACRMACACTRGP